jgi:hypothetical protein
MRHSTILLGHICRKVVFNNCIPAILDFFEAIANSNSTATNMSLLPPAEAAYLDPTTAFTAIQAHAKAYGYALIQRDKTPTRILYTCDRAGKYSAKGKDPNMHKSKQRVNTGSKKCSCLMRVSLCFDSVSSTWVLKVLEATHTHGPSAAVTAHPAHRIAAISLETHASISTLSRVGLSPRQILMTLRKSDPDIPLITKDIANLAQKDRLIQLDGMSPIQWLLKVYIPRLLWFLAII